MKNRVKASWKVYRFISAITTCSVICVLNSAPASAAGVTLSATSVAAAAGSSMNSFDVDLTNFGSSALEVSGFNFELSIADAAISFTDVNTSTAAGYIFAGNSLFGPDLSGPNSGQTVSASDIVLSPSTATTVSPGQEVGIGHVLFNVALGATPGIFAVNIAPFPNTSLSDLLGNTIDINVASPGQITITAAPEPSCFLLVLSLGTFALLYRIRPTGRIPNN